MGGYWGTRGGSKERKSRRWVSSFLGSNSTISLITHDGLSGEEIYPKLRTLRPRSEIPRAVPYQYPMTKTMSHARGNEKAVQQKRRSPRPKCTMREPKKKFTERRRKAMEQFMEKAIKAPQRYGKIGSKKWIAGALNEMKEPRSGLCETDVTQWLDVHRRFFNKTSKRLKLSVDDQREPEPLPSLGSPAAGEESDTTCVVPRSRDVNSESPKLTEERNDECTVESSGNLAVALISQNDLAINSDVNVKFRELILQAVREADPQIVLLADGRVTVFGQFEPASLRAELDRLLDRSTG